MVFRAMQEESDGLPVVARSARALGVRPNVDIPVGGNGLVQPGTGGMSVALDAARNLPKHRRPRTLGGEGRDPVFEAGESFTGSLVLRRDAPPHALVEPSGSCGFEDFERAIGRTRPDWRKVQ